MDTSLIELDGSEGEGGGQILRTALTLSVITGRPFKLVNIRARRSQPGLRPQHLTCVRAAGSICGGHYKGASVGSSVLYFGPGAVKSGAYSFPIGTAGATALVLQTVFLPLALTGTSPSEVVVTGGTHNEHAPCYHFLETTWRGYLARLGFELDLEMIHPGFYPRGGGEIRATIPICQRVHPLHLSARPELTTAGGFSATAGLDDAIGKRQARRLAHLLKQRDIESHIPHLEWQAACPGSVAAIIFRQAPIPTLFFGLGERGKPAESVADEAAREALAYLDTDCPVDPHSADQLLLPLVFATGPSEYRTSSITRHLLTNRETVMRFVDREIEIEGEMGGVGTVRVR